jgi:hypothetical protein
MLTTIWRRKPGQVLTVLTVLASLSGVAQAQQSGLFPLHPIKRQRVPCPNEDPIYKLYRTQYYGYYPTQWRPFPQGWNLPSPEGPNTQAVLAKQPIEAAKPPGPEEGEGEEMPGQPPARPAAPNLPTIPPERSPFELDRPDAAGAAPGAGGPARRTAPARPNATRPGAQPSPFDMPDAAPGDSAAPPATQPRGTQPSRPTTPPQPGGNSPDLAPPGPAPAAPRTSQADERDESIDRDSGPLLAMPDASLPAVEEATSSAGSTALASSPPASGAPASSFPMATQQPVRRGRLSSLFGGVGLNWLRR